MNRFGTCRHTFQIQEVYAEDGRQKVVDTTEDYTCQYLDSLGKLPPPVARANGSFAIRREDCDRCPRYEPAWTGPLKT
jgi:hypothetical protein